MFQKKFNKTNPNMANVMLSPKEYGAAFFVPISSTQVFQLLNLPINFFPLPEMVAILCPNDMNTQVLNQSPCAGIKMDLLEATRGFSATSNKLRQVGGA